MNLKFDRHFLKVKDHSVSKEFFDLFHDKDFDLLSTRPQPNPDDLPRYYDSDDYISHTDGKRSLFERAYHLVKGIALKNKTDLLARLQPIKGNLLDIGAGTGDFLSAAKSNGWNVSGAEPSEKARAIAQKKGITLHQNTSNLQSQSFDFITMWHVLEHVPDLDAQIKELKRLLKPGGTLIVAVPNFNSYDAQHYGEFWAAYDVPRHLWHFSKSAIVKLFDPSNMSVQQVLPMKFDSFYVCLLSEKYKNGKMNYVKAFLLGLKSNRKARKSGEYSSHIYVIGNKIS